MAKKIINIRKNEDRHLTVKLEDGTELDYNTALNMAKNGELEWPYFIDMDGMMF